VVPDAVERLHAEVERLEGDVGAVDGVVVAAGEIRGERILGGVARRAVTAVVREGDGLDERKAEVGHPGDPGGDLCYLDGVREPGAEMIVFGGGVFGPATKFLDRISAEARRWAQPIAIDQVRFAASELGSDAGLFGAGRLAMTSGGET